MKFGTKHSEASKELMRQRRKGLHSKSDHYAWKGGRYTNPDGYVLVLLDPDHPHYLMAGKVGNGQYVLEHRLVMAKSIGRNLDETEVVHHQNHVRDDNRIENLRLFADSNEHMDYHSGIRSRNEKGQYV